MESVEMEIGTAEVRLLFPPAAGKDTRLLLDCRTIEEYATAKIIGSMLIPMQDIPARLAELEPCSSRRTRQCLRRLRLLHGWRVVLVLHRVP